MMNSTTAPLYSIPARLRKMENLHIVFWLCKDMSWCLSFRTLGILFIIPTIAVAIRITHLNRHIKSELMHNMAVIFWIAANSTWMICEFFGWDEKPIVGSIEGRYLAMIPFTIGALFLIFYYLFIKPREMKTDHEVTM